MSWKFLNYLLSFLGFSKESPNLPKDIGHNEKICRTIYSPINLRKGNRLDPNLFKSPRDKDEVSVNRLDYTTPEFCKRIAKKHQNPLDRRTYYGFAVVNQYEILSVNFTTVYSPILKPKSELNLFHADIKAGSIVRTGQTMPSALSKKINDLVKKARHYADPDTLSDEWKGNALT